MAAGHFLKTGQLALQLTLGILAIQLPQNPHVRTVHLVSGAALFSLVVAGTLLAHRRDAVAWHDGPDAGARERREDALVAETSAVADRVAAPGTGWRGLLRTLRREAPYWAQTLPAIPRLLHRLLAAERMDGLQAALEGLVESAARAQGLAVEADALAGPLLARKAREAGIVYSLAYGDQPALICDLVDWARSCGFPVVAAGRGHKWLPHFSESTPETVWGYYGLTPEQAERGGLNPKMFNSFLDGSKPSIESTAVSNATGLGVPSNGLLYPPASVEDIPFVTRPIEEGGVLERKGMVEVISSLEANGRKIPYDIRMGVWVTVEAETEYIKNCFEEYNAHTDPSGRYFTLYKRWHLIGLELGVSVASVALRGEPTGVATCWNADVVATAKKDLKVGDMLDGEGGYTVWGKLLPAQTSVTQGGLPLGLAHQVKLVRAVKKGQSLSWADVAIDTSTPAYQVRREMEALFAPGGQVGLPA